MICGFGGYGSGFASFYFRNFIFKFHLLSHNHRLSRWLAQPYKGMLLAGLKAHRTKKQQLQNCAASTNVELCFNDITILRYALSGIVVFQSKTTPTMLNFYVITYLTFCFLFNGKSLFGTTRLAGGFRMPKKKSVKPGRRSGQ